MPIRTKEEKKKRQKKKAELEARSPEAKAEEKKRQAEGQAIIQRREKLASKQDISSKRAGQQIAAQEEGRAPTGQTTVAEAQAAKVEATGQLTQEGAFEQVTPQTVPLAPIGTPDVPVVGAAGGAIASVLFNAQEKGWLKNFPTISVGKGAVAEREAEFPVPLTPETLREAALTEIRDTALQEGITKAESFGSMVEAIPVAGGLIGKYVGGLVEAPYANQKNVLKHINDIREAASTGQEKVRNGLEDPEYGLTRAREMEEQVAKLEGRMKLLINTSAILRANTDEVNEIQERILEAKEKIARYRTASSFGLTAQMTGTGRVIPTDEQMFMELKNQKE